MRARVVLSVVAIVFFLSFAVQFRTELIDDAYISLTYARHLAEGHGLVWNPGERVEGYTDFLWVLMLSLLGATPQAAWWLGTLAGAALLALLAFRLSEPLRAHALLAALPVAVAAHLSYAFWAAKGLETILYTLLLTVGLLLYAERGSPRRALLGIHLLALAALTRPEGLLFVGLASLEALRRRDLAPKAYMVLPILLLLPHLLFRLSYYGYPLPNTFYAKVGLGAEQLLRGLNYLSKFFGSPASLLFLFAFAYPRSTSAAERTLLAGLLAGLGAVALLGGDAFGAHRFVVPLIPILFLVTLAGMGRVARRLPSSTRRAAGVCAASLFVIAMFGDSRGAVLSEEEEVTNFTSLMIRVGRTLKVQTRPEDVIALNPAGAIPYYSERRAIDMLGLNDEHIAHVRVKAMGRKLAGHEKGDGAYVLSRQPELILIGNVWVDEVTRITTLRPSRPSEIQITKSPALYELYEPILFRLDDGSFLKALGHAEKLGLERTQWAPTEFIPAPKGRWE